MFERQVIRLSAYEDETAAAVAENSLLIPQSHYLESWGDARTSDGTLVPIQPLIAPLFNGMTELELLARICGLPTTNPYEIVRETYRTLVGSSEDAWKKFLHDGFQPDTAAKAVEVVFDPTVVAYDQLVERETTDQS